MNIIRKTGKIFKYSACELKNLLSLTFCGLLLAIRTILGYLTVLVVPTVKLGFAFAPTAVAGIMYGPVPAALIGGLGDVLSYVFNPVGGSYFPGFTLNGIIIGMIYGLFFYNKKLTLLRVIVCEVIIIVFVELLLSSLWLVIMFGNAYIAVLASRLLKAVIMLPIDVSVIMLFYKPAVALKKHSLARR